jgi:Protein of unknown function (DUF2971)
MVEEDSNHFFKYREISEKTFDLLENQELCFNKPSKFNDPFDSKFDIIWSGTITDWNRFFWNRGEKDPIIVRYYINKGVKSGILNKKGSIYTLNPRNKKFKNIDENLHSQDDDYPRICCFSKVKNNILMWSHYADGHKGICLCFKSEKKGDGNFLILDSNPEIFLPVKYKEKDNEELPKQVNMLSKYDLEELSAFLLTKHFLWTYEKEYRIILYKTGFNGKFTKSFRKEDLEGIIFGIKTPISDVRKVYEKIKSKYLDKSIKVNFYKAQEMQDMYATHIKKIDNMNRYLKKMERSA